MQSYQRRKFYRSRSLDWLPAISSARTGTAFDVLPRALLFAPAASVLVASFGSDRRKVFPPRKQEYANKYVRFV
jgi:hypothetical protein